VEGGHVLVRKPAMITGASWRCQRQRDPEEKGDEICVSSVLILLRLQFARRIRSNQIWVTKTASSASPTTTHRIEARRRSIRVATQRLDSTSR
jgi:hypothetical protein